MSFIYKLISGGGSKEKTLSPQEVIQMLQETEKKLLGKCDCLESKISQEVATAKKSERTKNRIDALAALRRKKILEKELIQIDGTVTIMEFQREALETARSKEDVLRIMAPAVQALKDAQKYLDDDDKLHDLVGDVDVAESAKQQQQQSIISNEISNNGCFGHVGLNTDIDEDDLLAELEEIMEEEEALDEQKRDDASGTTKEEEKALDEQKRDDASGATKDCPNVPTAEPCVSTLTLDKASNCSEEKIISPIG